MRGRLCNQACRMPRAGAPGKAVQAVQPPASLVAVASSCLSAVSPNAQCMQAQALCLKARCLTLYRDYLAKQAFSVLHEIDA
jgi:hypothetical protein